MNGEFVLSTNSTSESQNQHMLTEVVRQLVNSPPKGIFLIDDFPEAVGLRLRELKMPNEQVYREDYYEVFLSALESRYISAISVSQEIIDIYDLKNSDSVGKKSILIGLRLDMGIVPLNYNAIKNKEFYTEGIEYVAERLAQCANIGLSFTRWRSVYNVSQNTPTYFCLMQNSKSLARFAAISQSHGLVPLTEIELIKMGNYSLDLGTKVLEKVLAALTKAFIEEEVNIKGTIVQIHMLSGGEGIEKEKTVSEIAQATFIPMKRTLPTGLGGVVISSGGLSEELASSVLNEIAAEARNNFPWPVTFAFGRALQHSALKAWAGNYYNINSAQEEFKRRQEANTCAISGSYSAKFYETPTSSVNLYTDEYIY